MRAFQNIVFVIVLMMAPLALAEEDDILVGRSAEGKLKFETSYVQPFELPASIFAGISGCATGSLGVHANDLDDLGNDFFTLSTASDLRFILLAKDPGMEVWNDHGSSHMGVGENFFIGPPYFDTHPIWNLVTGTPGNTYSLALKLHDVNEVYSDSDPFTLSFTAQIVRHQISIARTDA